MENNSKVNFIRINHKNRIDYFNEDKLVEFKMNLFSKLSNMQEKDFSNNLNKYTQHFIPNYSDDDQMEINYRLSKKYYEINSKVKFERKCPETLLILEKILNQNFNMEFKCNETFVEFLSKILYFCFQEIKTNNKNYSIKNFKEFKNILSDLSYENVTLKEYVIITKEESKNKYKNSKNSGKIVQSFNNLEEIDIKLNYEQNNNKSKIITNNNICNNHKINDQNIQDIENSQNLSKYLIKYHNPNEDKNLLENKSDNVIETSKCNSSLINENSVKSSFQSIGDSYNITTKKSTFSSCCNIIGENFIASNGDSKEYNCDKDQYFVKNSNDLQKNICKVKILSSEDFNKNIDVNDRDHFEGESNIKKMKRKSCQILSNKHNFTVLNLVSQNLNMKKITNTVIEKRKNKSFKILGNETSCISYKDNKNINKNNIKHLGVRKEKVITCIEKDKDMNSFNNSSKRLSLNFSNASEFFKLNFSHIINLNKKIYVEYKNEKYFYEYGVPIYLILLVQKLMTIKKLTIKIPKKYKSNPQIEKNYVKGLNSLNNYIIDNFSIVLLNIEWLFQNLLEIEIDFCVGSNLNFDKFFKVKYNSEKSSIVYGKKFKKIVDDYRQSIELLLIVCNLCSKFTNLYILTLNNFSCYHFELDYLTKNYHEELKFLHILDIFNNYIKLIKLNVNFNALDTSTFEHIINLIQINNNLKSINFDFRIDGEDFSLSFLKRIYLKNYLDFNHNYTKADNSIQRPDYNDKKDDNIEENNTSYGYLQSLYQNGLGFFKKNSNYSIDIIKKDDNNYRCSNQNKIGRNSNINDNKYNNMFFSERSSMDNSISFFNKTNIDYPSHHNSNHNNNNKYGIDYNFKDKLNISNYNQISPKFNSERENSEIQSVLNFLDEDNENKFIELILIKFEPLLEELFLILDSKKNLMELNFNINLPNIISSNDNFIMTIQKFIFNIFKSLNCSENNLKTLKIKSPYLCFNNRKFPVIEKFINTIDLHKNNDSLINFTLDIQINKIPNIVNLIPKNVQYLYLGEFDIETFLFFKKNFIETNLFLKSKINFLILSFNGSILEKSFLINEFKYIFNSEKPHKLKEIQVLSNLIVDKFFLREIFLSIKADNIEKYYFEFNQQSLENFNYFRSNLQKINIKGDKDKFYENRLNYFFNILKKYKINIEVNLSRKIIYNIIKFVTDIYVTNIEMKIRE